MRLYDNPWLAITYLLGKGAQNAKNKLQNSIDERDKKKELESAISYLSSDEKERKRRSEIAEKREKWAIRSLLIVILEPIFLLILTASLPDKELDLPPALALIVIVIIMSPLVLSIIYGLWYSLEGKYL